MARKVTYGGKLKMSIKRKVSKNISVIIVLCFILVQSFNGNLALQKQNLVQDNNLLEDISFDNSYPSSSVIIENQTIYSKQLINDPNFDIGSGLSSWGFETTDDVFDTYPNYQNNQIDLDVIGDIGTYSMINTTPHPTDWNAVQNPDFQVWPDSYTIDEFGFNVSHTWDENVNQTTNTPSVLWKRNIEMPVNMSDYEITNASISSIANATVDASIDTLTDNPTVGAVGDHVRFFIRVESIDGDKSFEIASNKTSVLGQDDPLPDILTMADTYLDSIPTDILIFYLTSVLEGNYFNFTLVAGINIYCEDNVPGADYDKWDELRIKEVNLSIEYEKKIDKSSSVSLKQIGSKINSTEYENKSISINNASLCFDYILSREWSNSSQNSEIRVYVNNYLHSESIKLQNTSTSGNTVKDGDGFDIASLLQVDQNVSIRIQLFLADDFLLDQNITLTIDNVYLNVSYTVIESREPTVTSLNTLDGKNNYDVIWNSTKTIILNYTEIESLPAIPINMGAFSINWVDDYSPVQFVGEGIYQFDINTSSVSADLSYSLEITPDNTGTWYNTQPLILEINIVGRPTYCNLFSNGTDVDDIPVVEVPYDSPMNLTSWFYDNETKTSLLSATVNITGNNIDSSAYVFTLIDDRYQFMLNTSKIGLGTHLISIYLSKPNYEQSSKQIRVRVIGRESYFDIFLNEVNSSLSPHIDLEYDQSLNITTQLLDETTSDVIQDATVQLVGVESNYSVTPAGHQFLVNTINLSIGIHYISLVASSPSHLEYSELVEVQILPRSVDLAIYVNGSDFSLLTQLEVRVNNVINISGSLIDSELDSALDDVSFSLDGVDLVNVESSTNGLNHQFLLYTENLTLGVHFVTILAQKENYEQISKVLQIKVLAREFYYDISLNGINSSIAPNIGTEFNTSVNITVQLIDSLTFEPIHGATVLLSEVISDYRTIVSEHEFIVDTSDLNIGIHYLSLTGYSDKHLEMSRIIELQILPRSVDLDVFVDDLDFSLLTQVEVPINHNLTISGAMFDSESAEIISDVTFTLVGLNSSQFSDSFLNHHYEFQINTAEMGLGVHFVTILSQKENYAQVTKILQVRIRPINTNITSQHFNSSYNLLPGEDFELGVIIEDLDNGGLISGCIVKYQSLVYSGNLTENENNIYIVPFESVQEGIHEIIITVYKGSDYKFDQFTITLNVIAPTSDSIPPWAFYTMGVALAGLASSFIAYQKYFKYPKIVRDIKKLKRSIKHGKSFNISTKTRNDLFMGSYVYLVKDLLPGKVQGQLKSNASKGNGKKGSATKSDILSLVLPSGDTIAPYKPPIVSTDKIEAIPTLDKSPEVPPVLADALDVSKPSSNLVQNEVSTVKLTKPHLKPDALAKKKPKDITFRHRPQIKELKPKSDD